MGGTGPGWLVIHARVPTPLQLPLGVAYEAQNLSGDPEPVILAKRVGWGGLQSPFQFRDSWVLGSSLCLGSEGLSLQVAELGLHLGVLGPLSLPTPHSVPS